MSTPALNSMPMAHRFVQQLAVGGEPAVKGMVRLIQERFANRCTLLAVCPNSEAVTRAALQAAQEAGAPLLLAATLNQVDRDGGYTGWTPQALVDVVAREADRLGFDGPVVPGLDHGGPWQKDTHVLAGRSYQATLTAVKRSIEACLDAGYLHLHIDATVDYTDTPEGTPASPAVCAERTLALIAHAEAYRTRQGLPPVSYEVGGEEEHGGLADPDAFLTFLDRLDRGLHEQGLTDVWPTFVVGNVGTHLHTTRFDPGRARRLTVQIAPYGALLKGHYTDYVVNLEDYPRSGMGGANIGPELTDVEYQALMDLVALGRKLSYDARLGAVLRQAVVASGRWTKWLLADEQGHAFEALDEARQTWLVRTGSRYVWTHPEVRAARRQLYDYLAPYRDAEAYVIWRIKEAILRYYHAFNMIGFNDRLFAALPKPEGEEDVKEEQSH